MRAMHRRLAVGAMCLALIATASVLPQLAPSAYATTSCSGWKSSFTPPLTIRVLRSYGSASGTVQTVDFRAYVENVLAWEWPSTYPPAALRAGAIAVKQYAWYYAIHYRGGVTSRGACYDVRDTTADQIYRPETRTTPATTKAAITATWSMHVRRTRNGLPGQFILTGYRTGTITTCGAEKNGFVLYERGVYDCARKGMTLEEIQRLYYGSTLQPIRPGAHQIGGGAVGDAAVTLATKTGFDALVRTSTASAFVTPANTTHVAIPENTVLARVSADVTGDGLDDLVVLVADGATAQHLVVLPATGTDYGAPVTWWASTVAATAFPSQMAVVPGARGVAGAPGVPGVPGVRLLAGDFDGDGVTDVALVVTGTDPATATVYRLRSTASGFEGLVPLYTGVLNPATSRFFGADFTGDGRADVVVESDLGAGGLVYGVLSSRLDRLLNDPLPWYAAPDLQRATTLATMTDFDRDGRDDLVLATATGTGFTLLGLRATGVAFTPATLATSVLGLDRIKLGSGDFNGDGYGDVLAYTSLDGGAPGSRLTAYLSTGASFTAAAWLDDPALIWKTILPY